MKVRNHMFWEALGNCKGEVEHVPTTEKMDDTTAKTVEPQKLNTVKYLNSLRSRPMIVEPEVVSDIESGPNV